jgi:hypothetical protein
LGRLPIFALAIAGVRLAGVALSDLLHSSRSRPNWGRSSAKSAGVIGAIWVATRIGLAKLPDGTDWLQFYGVALLTGIGFTMSLFIGTLAFPAEAHETDVRASVLLASLIFRDFWLRRFAPRVAKAPAGQRVCRPMTTVKKTVVTPGRRRASVALGDRRRSFAAWQDRIRDPSLTGLLVLELFLVFLAAPLAAKGLPMARRVVEALLLAMVAVVVLLSRRPGAILAIALGVSATLASGLFEPAAASALFHGGRMLALSAATWVVAHAVFAPGRITFRRLQGAAVVYLNFAMIFASAFGLIWENSPGAYAGLPAAMGAPGELATMMYFSLTTLTTTGYGDIAPIEPFARGLANLESVIGQFYLAIIVARLVTLELQDRRR